MRERLPAFWWESAGEGCPFPPRIRVEGAPTAPCALPEWGSRAAITGTFARFPLSSFMHAVGGVGASPRWEFY